MRKSNKRQQSKADGQQWDLFSSTKAPQRPTTDGIGNGEDEGVELGSRLSRPLVSTEKVLEEITSLMNLGGAYKQVRINDGSPGVDGMRMEDLG